MMRGRNIDGWLGPHSPATRQLLTYYDWMQHTNLTTLCRYSLVAQETIRWYHEMVEGEKSRRVRRGRMRCLDGDSHSTRKSYARGGHYSFYGSAGTWQAWGEECVCVYVSPRRSVPRIIADGAPDAGAAFGRSWGWIWSRSFSVFFVSPPVDVFFFHLYWRLCLLLGFGILRHPN